MPAQRGRGAVLADPSAHVTEGCLRPEDRALAQGWAWRGLGWGAGLGSSQGALYDTRGEDVPLGSPVGLRSAWKRWGQGMEFDVSQGHL